MEVEDPEITQEYLAGKFTVLKTKTGRSELSQSIRPKSKTVLPSKESDVQWVWLLAPVLYNSRWRWDQRLVGSWKNVGWSWLGHHDIMTKQKVCILIFSKMPMVNVMEDVGNLKKRVKIFLYSTPRRSRRLELLKPSVIHTMRISLENDS